ncbi:MAG TPA: hypothetical protein PLR50_02955, partial [Candidatus Rifleibacterium sp.]|nr:hypothetical protein [Candidatus Rifleibacterium sp.]
DLQALFRKLAAGGKGHENFEADATLVDDDPVWLFAVENAVNKINHGVSCLKNELHPAGCWLVLPLHPAWCSLFIRDLVAISWR